MGRLLLKLFGYLVVGSPLVLFIWHEFSEALLGRVHGGRLAAATLLLPVLLMVLTRLRRDLIALEEQEL